MIFRFFADSSSFEAALRTGGIDALGESSGLSLDAALAMKARLRKTHIVETRPSGVWLHIDFRLDDPLFSLPTARRAVDQAIDRPAMADLLYGGHAVPAYGCFPPAHPGHSKPAPRPVNRRAARDLLAVGGVAPKTRLAYATGSVASEKAALFVQDALAKIGLEVTLQAMPLRILFHKMRQGQGAPMTLYAWRAGPDWLGESVLRSGGRQNYSGLKDGQIDGLYDRLNQLSDLSARQDKLRRIERRFIELLPSVPLLFRDSVSVRPVGLRNWRPTGTTTPVTWNAEQWQVEDPADFR